MNMNISSFVPFAGVIYSGAASGLGIRFIGDGEFKCSALPLGLRLEKYILYSMSLSIDIHSV